MGVAVLLLVGGCVTEPRAGDESRSGSFSVAPSAPAEIEQVTRALMTYRATHGRLPAELVQLVEADVLPQQTYDALPDYTYAAEGLGILPDGRRILLVDVYIRGIDHAWCIVQDATRGPGAAQVELVFLPMDALRHAANR